MGSKKWSCLAALSNIFEQIFFIFSQANSYPSYPNPKGKLCLWHKERKNLI